MFFDDDDLVLIDWQLLGQGDGMGDVVPFLTCNLDPALGGRTSPTSSTSTETPSRRWTPAMSISTT